MPHRVVVAFTVAVLALAVAACGGGDGGISSITTAAAPTTVVTTEEPTTTTEASTTTTEEPTTTTEEDRPRPTVEDGPDLPDDIYGVDFSDLDLPVDDPPAGYDTIEDDTETIRIEVPEGWSDRDTRPIDYTEAGAAPSIWASGDLDRYTEYYDLGGLKFDVLTHASVGSLPEDVLTHYADLSGTSENCDDFTDVDYDDGLYSGTARMWTGCPAGAAILHVAAAPNPAGTWYLGLEIQMATTAHVDAAVHALESFKIIGDVDATLANDVATDTRPVPAPSPTDTMTGENEALAILSGHMTSCGMDWEDPYVTDQGSGLWEISVYLLPGPDMGDPGEGIYLIDLTDGSVTSVNGTANVLCPG